MTGQKKGRLRGSQGGFFGRSRRLGQAVMYSQDSYEGTAISAWYASDFFADRDRRRSFEVCIYAFGPRPWASPRQGTSEDGRLKVLLLDQLLQALKLP